MKNKQQKIVFAQYLSNVTCTMYLHGVLGLYVEVEGEVHVTGTASKFRKEST